MITIFLPLRLNTIHLFWMKLNDLSMEQVHQYDETRQEGKVSGESSKWKVL
jgi:hypothetical protein